MENEDKYPSQLAERFQIRLPDGMRERIKLAAEKNNRSMNAEIVATLEEKYPTSPYEYLIDAYLANENIEQHLEDELRRYLRNALPRFETDDVRKKYINLMIDGFKKMQNGDF